MPKYKDILGKSIIYNGKECFVAGVNPKIGITLKDINSKDPEDWVYCFVVKTAIEEGMTRKENNHLFYRRVALIRKNSQIGSNEMEKLRNEEGTYSPMLSWGTCPFSS